MNQIKHIITFLLVITFSIKTMGQTYILWDSKVFVDEPDVTATFKGNKLYIKTVFGKRYTYNTQFGEFNSKKNTRTIRKHRGGYLYKARAMVLRANDHNEKVRLLCDQGCISAATLWLDANNLCIGKNAWFGFHGASDAKTKKQREYLSKNIIPNFYPKEIRDEYINTWSNQYGSSYYRVTAKYLKKHLPNIEYCP